MPDLLFSSLVMILSDLFMSVLTTDRLCFRWWFDVKFRYWSMCVAFRYTVTQVTATKNNICTWQELVICFFQKRTRRPWTLALCMAPAIGMPNINFLQTCFTVTYGLAPLQDIGFEIWVTFNLTCQGHYRSYVMMSLGSPYMPFC